MPIQKVAARPVSAWQPMDQSVSLSQPFRTKRATLKMRHNGVCRPQNTGLWHDKRRGGEQLLRSRAQKNRRVGRKVNPESAERGASEGIRTLDSALPSHFCKWPKWSWFRILRRILRKGNRAPRPQNASRVCHTLSHSRGVTQAGLHVNSGSGKNTCNEKASATESATSLQPSR